MPNSDPEIGEQERHEAAAAVERKAQTLVNQIKKSKHFIAFTGAGISTSAGIPDFRGPEGAWTLRAQGKQSKAANTLTAIPTPTHMALVELQNQGILKYLVSQNCDGLHRRSGILPDRISELHGNSNREHCKECGKEYIRDFRAVASHEKDPHDHHTGRRCVSCNGALLDSIVNFDEYLPEEPLENARANARKADLCLVLGSSLTVPPANGIPEIVGLKKGAKLAICNLQTTGLDKVSDLRIHAKTDELMIKVMEKLNFAIPTFILHRRLVVEMEMKADARHQVRVHGIDVDGTPVSFLRSVKLEGERRAIRAEPFIVTLRDDVEIGMKFKLELEFMGHYGEPNLVVTHEYNGGGDKKALYLLEYNPQTGEWQTRREVAEDRGQGDVEMRDNQEVVDLTADDSIGDFRPPPALPELAV